MITLNSENNQEPHHHHYTSRHLHHRVGLRRNGSGPAFKRNKEEEMMDIINTSKLNQSFEQPSRYYKLSSPTLRSKNEQQGHCCCCYCDKNKKINNNVREMGRNLLSISGGGTRLHAAGATAKKAKCDQKLSSPTPKNNTLLPLLMATQMILVLLILSPIQSMANSNHNHHRELHGNTTVIIEQHQHQSIHQSQQQASSSYIGLHLQPAFVYGARNHSVNFTHLLVDELTGSVYVGATNWLFQLSASNLKAEHALRTGPLSEGSPRDCSPTDCQAQIGHIDTQLLPMHHAHGFDLSVPQSAPGSGASSGGQSVRRSGGVMQSGLNNLMMMNNMSHAFLAPPRQPNSIPNRSSQGPPTQDRASTNTATNIQNTNNQHNNNYNKILVVDPESRQLIFCGSLSQGACRRHQLGQISNYSELIPVPVASNDEHSSSVGLVVTNQQQQTSNPNGNNNGSRQKPVIYVAATNSRLGGASRQQVPAISARYLDPPSRAMQIIERSFTDSASIDISFELRDYYLVNYVHTFQHNDFIYFATIQRKSPLRQFEEWGYITRLARLCLNDLSFQSYTEITLECKSQNQMNLPFSRNRYSRSQYQQTIIYNLLQDAYLAPASSHLAQQLGIRPQSAILMGAFAQSKDHTTKSLSKSAVCLFPLERIEQKFNENIHMCYNGTSRARNMNYIAGSVNDCPKAGKAGNIANFCNEPLKLNGSLPMTAQPVITYDEQLLTAIASTQAPTSPINSHNQQQQLTNRISSPTSQRQHQVLILGTGEGSIKKVALVSSQSASEFSGAVHGVEFDSVQVADRVERSEQQQQQADHSTSAFEPILADLHLMPTSNPQQAGSSNSEPQYAILGTSAKIVKLRVNSCKISSARLNSSSSTSVSTSDECQLCAQLQDPFCGWCASSRSCSSRDDCFNFQETTGSSGNPLQAVHWTPFDLIKCADYQPIWPQFVPIQSTQHQVIDVNIRLKGAGSAMNALGGAGQLGLQLAQAHFICYFDYLSLLSNRTLVPNISGATTKATQARLALHSSSVVIGCPLPPIYQRPSNLNREQTRVKLSVRLVSSHLLNGINESSFQQLLGMKRLSSTSSAVATNADISTGSPDIDQIEREFTLYDCSQHYSCNSCLSQTSLNTHAGSQWWSANYKSPNGGHYFRGYSCQWCPLSNKCTFNASHPDLGCAASVIISTTPHSTSFLGQSKLNSVRGSHLASSLDQAQADVYSTSFERLSQCPVESSTVSKTNIQTSLQEPTTQLISNLNPTTPAGTTTANDYAKQSKEILIPHNARQSIRVQLKSPLLQKRQPMKLECLIEIEGAKMKVPARLQADNEQELVCQEQLFGFQEEIATISGLLSVIQNDNQVIETMDVILYKCNLFGVNPPALTNTVGAGPSHPNVVQHSTVAWRPQDIFNFEPSTSGRLTRRHAHPASSGPMSSDCSLCSNIERKYQCFWCANQCQHSAQCSGLPAPICPPPQINSIHPTSGPLEGGTLLTIEGTNLGSNEREIQDKISVGGSPCQLYMYSVSTRIVCKTGPSSHGAQAATVHVRNRAGIASALEEFHYKAVHLTDVFPRMGPVSGGTRLILRGSNLNVGSRVQIFLDDIPCALDSHNDPQASNDHLSCITAPNLLASSMRITRLTLMIDNSTRYLPFPFTYHPDPIITRIEPAESFVSGGRLILIAGQHLASPQSTKLVVYHEHKRNIINGTNCITQNDTLMTCLTPSISRDMLLDSQQQQQQQQSSNGDFSGDSSDLALLNYEAGGLKLKMSLFMDDVKSVRNLDEYYHHLPHYIAYFNDPRFFRFGKQVIEYTGEELTIMGENLRMKQLDQDILITIGSSHICPLKSIQSDRITCEPPAKVSPHFDENGHLLERAQLPIVALIGSNLRYPIGYIQYTSQHYQQQQQIQNNGPSWSINNGGIYPLIPGSSSASSMNSPDFIHPNGSSGNGAASMSLAILTAVTIFALLVAFGTFLVFALSRFRQSKAEREYRRIQLQMGSLDINGQPLGGGSLIDTIHINGNRHQTPSMIGTANSRLRTLDYVGSALSGKKLFYQFSGTNGDGNTNANGMVQQGNSFPPSPLTDISSLTGTNSVLTNQHVVKLSSNGTIINMAHHHYNKIGSGNNSSQSSPNSTRNSEHNSNASSNPFSSSDQQQQQQQQQQANFHHHHHQQQQQHQQTLLQHHSSGVGGGSEKSNNNLLTPNTLASHQMQQAQSNNINCANSRNFNWTQEAPSTIVPYAVIEACNLTLEGKNAIKEYV